MSHPLPKEIMDKIEEEAVKYANEPHYKGGGKYSASPILYKKIGYRDAAIHYSQIIEQKEKEIEKLKESIELKDYAIIVRDKSLVTFIDTRALDKSEIEQLKAENGRILKALVDLVYLKNYKEAMGKTEEYLKQQPVFWENARQVIESLK